jgi:hypothetical protein
VPGNEQRPDGAGIEYVHGRAGTIKLLFRGWVGIPGRALRIGSCLATCTWREWLDTPTHSWDNVTESPLRVEGKQMRLHAFVSCLVLVLVAPAFAPGFEEIRITNKSPVSLNVWFWKAEKNAWIQPSVVLESQETSTVRLAEKRYYLVATTTTSDPETLIIGWVDFEKLHRRSGTASLVLDGSLVTRTKESAYTVYKPVYETRETQMPVMRRRNIAGQCQWVEETITEYKTVSKMVPEHHVRTAVVQELSLNPIFSDSQGQLTSRVTFKTEKQGAFVRYRLAGRDETNTGRNPTDSTEELPVGIYVFWTERNEKPTSTKRRYDIYREKEVITIPETVSAP